MLISLENIYLLVYYSDKYVQSLRNTVSDFVLLYTDRHGKKY
jgi:hypothetical protein